MKIISALRMLSIRGTLIITLLTVTACPLGAAEFSLLGGVVQNPEEADGSYSWEIEYREHLKNNFSVAATYLNEGHTPGHHRDGYSLALWQHLDLMDRRLSLSAGIGPYFYLDTNADISHASYRNQHGFGALFGLGATWRLTSDWLLQLRANAVKTFDNIDTFSTLLGIGYDFEGREQPAPPDLEISPDKQAKRNEVTFFLGQTIINSFNSEKGLTASIEYRRHLMPYIDGTVAWLYEADNRLLRNNGVSAQLWGAKSFLDEQMTLGAGAGAYFLVSRNHGTETRATQEYSAVSAIVSMTASYRIQPEFSLRTSWHRIVTNYDYDSDIILLGIGYGF